MIKQVIKKIRLWNPKYFPNPFYSPSLAMAEAGQKMGQDMARGIEDGIRGEFTGFSPESWAQLQRSARAATFFQDDDEG